jgi:trimethylamine:corrinoid methyltransferase-like protein
LDVVVETAHSDDWEESGKKIFQERASDSVKQILREYEKPDTLYIHNLYDMEKRHFRTILSIFG